MSMTLQEISGMFTRGEIIFQHFEENQATIAPILKHQITEEGYILFVPLPTKSYVNEDGKKKLHLYISLHEFPVVGQVFALHTTEPLVSTRGRKHRDAAIKFCSIMQSNDNPVQFCYDLDADIYARIKIPLGDNKLTSEQLSCSIAAIHRVVDNMYAKIHHVLDTGDLPLPDEAKESLSAAENGSETTII